jgi:hypothetical protein
MYKVGKSKATVVGAFNEETGKVVAAACGNGKCAEANANTMVGGADGFSRAFRPRTFDQKAISPNCEKIFGRDKFPPGTKFESDGYK